MELFIYVFIATLSFIFSTVVFSMMYIDYKSGVTRKETVRRSALWVVGSLVWPIFLFVLFWLLAKVIFDLPDFKEFISKKEGK